MALRLGQTGHRTMFAAKDINMNYDTLVLGAGIVGICTALHLQRLGQSVALIDRDGPGEGTSFGNAGLIERSSVIPHAFPHGLGRLLRYAANRRSDVRYAPGALPRLAPWLARYWYHSSPTRLAAAAQMMLPLLERCLDEHAELTREAGCAALVRQGGWVEVYRDAGELDLAQAQATTVGALFSLDFELLEDEALRALVPSIEPAVVGAVHWRDPHSVSDPGALTKAYAALFVARGGALLRADAMALRQAGDGWALASEQHGELRAANAVIALGPHSAALTGRLGLSIPLAVKRGYHMHYAIDERSVPQLPLLDKPGGYILSPMTRGVRLTTGVEFAAFDAPANTIQLDRAEALARRVLPLGARLDAAPWLGRRPALPDMRPVIGAVPRYPGLWLNFGHAHHGLTLGPISGRLLAELITGHAPVVDPSPYAPVRFKRG